MAALCHGTALGVGNQVIPSEKFQVWGWIFLATLGKTKQWLLPVAFRQSRAKCYILRAPELRCKAAPPTHLQSHTWLGEQRHWVQAANGCEGNGGGGLHVTQEFRILQNVVFWPPPNMNATGCFPFKNRNASSYLDPFPAPTENVQVYGTEEKKRFLSVELFISRHILLRTEDLHD